LTTSDKGKLAILTSTTNLGTGFVTGDTLSIYNNSAGNITINSNGNTLRLAGTSTTGNRTMPTRALATIVFVASDEAVMTGAGVN
jgi:hypothetical protein